MSYDREINQVCPHLIVDEPLLVSADNQTVRPVMPIASLQSVKLRINGEMSVPSYGVHIPAQSIGSKIEPYTVTTGVNDVLSLSVEGGRVQTITLPSLHGLSAKHVADLLNQRARGLAFTATHGRIMFRTISEGPQASVFIRPSALATVLGLQSNREYRGRTVVPGWTMITDPTTLDERPMRLIIFDRPLRDYSPHVEVSYSTIQQDCRRCGGIGFENDWRYGRNGEVGQVRYEALLQQQFQKLVFTLKGSNPFEQWYGTQITEAIGRKHTSGLVDSMIVSDIYQSFVRWQSIKQKQSEVGVFLSDEEYPFKLVSVTTTDDPADPTIVYVKCVLQNRSQRPIEIARGIRRPGDIFERDEPGVLRQSLSNLVLTG